MSRVVLAPGQLQGVHGGLVLPTANNHQPPSERGDRDPTQGADGPVVLVDKRDNAEEQAPGFVFLAFYAGGLVLLIGFGVVTDIGQSRDWRDYERRNKQPR